MNSKKLKNKHKNIYEQFFMRNNLVISLPLLLNWAGDIFSNFEGLKIKQKIPLRIYIGINKINKKEIRLNKIEYFDLNEEKFINQNIIEYSPLLLKIKNYLNKKYNTNLKNDSGYEINILSETSRGVGLGFNSVLTLGLFIVLEKVYKKIDYINSEDILINDFLNINTPIDNLFRLSLELNKQENTKISVETQISSFFDSYYPIVSFTENISNLKNLDLKDIKIFAYRLNNLEKKLSSIPFLPLDYGLIYSGSPVLVDHILNTSEDSYKWTLEIKSKLQKYFGNSLDNLLPNRKPKFYSTFYCDSGDIIKETYGKLMGTISLEMLNIMIKLYSSSYTESNMKNFISVINKLRHGNYITRKSSNTFSQFLDKIFGYFTSSLKNLGLAPNDTSIMGGTVIFTMPLEGFRKDLLLSIERAKKELPGVKLLYANWLDGIENIGFKIEQDLQENIFSNFVSKNSIILENNFGETKIIDNDYLNENFLEGLTLDLINRKIYLDGEKLTSKQIHSQNTTIEILEILLKNIGKDISNKDLPKLSYSSNKNEMLGKIVLPLVKLIEEKKKIKFPLICKGSIGEFYIKLKPSEFRINIIQKL